MKLLKIVISGLDLYQEDLVISLVSAKRVNPDSIFELNMISEKVFANPAVAFAGLNASGKTITLKLIGLIISMLNGENLNALPEGQLLLNLISSRPVTIYSYYWDQDYYCLKTVLGKRLSKKTFDEELIILNEALFVKKPRIKAARENWASLPDDDSPFYKLVLGRNETGDYLSVSVSLNVNRAQRTGSPIPVFSTMDSDCFDPLMKLNVPVPEILSFLDPSIEYLKREQKISNGPVFFLLKFKNQKTEHRLRSLNDLKSFLSEGTVKGLILFSMAACAIMSGGYLIADDLESHLNQAAADCLLKLFMSRRTNTKGAAILFSTHHPDLLDLPAGPDVLNILSHEDRIVCSRMSPLNRDFRQMLPSELYRQCLLEIPTAPSMFAFMDLKRAVEKFSRT